MRSLHLWWIALILARNVAILCAVIGFWHLRLYTQKAQGTDFKYTDKWLATGNPTFLFGSQSSTTWSGRSPVPCRSGPSTRWSTLWRQVNGVLPVVTFTHHPIYCVALALFIPLFRELHFDLHPPPGSTGHPCTGWCITCTTTTSISARGRACRCTRSSTCCISPACCCTGSCRRIRCTSIFHLQHLAFAPSQGHSGFEQAGARQRRRGADRLTLHALPAPPVFRGELRRRRGWCRSTSGAARSTTAPTTRRRG